jgi:predicted N-acetyltransferase YhbS
MSNGDISLDQLTVRLLSEGMDFQNFDCSHDDPLGVNEFIHKEALQYQNELRGVTYIFSYSGVCVGYVTVAMHAIEVKETRLRIVTSEKHYPALLLGRLGVHNDFRDRNIGSALCRWTIGFGKELSKRVGCKFVVLLTAPSKVKFYEKCGFEMCPKYERKQKVLMYFQLSQV